MDFFLSRLIIRPKYRSAKSAFGGQKVRNPVSCIYIYIMRNRCPIYKILLGHWKTDERKPCVLYCYCTVINLIFLLLPLCRGARNDLIIISSFCNNNYFIVVYTVHKIHNISLFLLSFYPPYRQVPCLKIPIIMIFDRFFHPFCRSLLRCAAQSCFHRLNPQYPYGYAYDYAITV